MRHECRDFPRIRSQLQLMLSPFQVEFTEYLTTIQALHYFVNCGDWMPLSLYRLVCPLHVYAKANVPP